MDSPFSKVDSRFRGNDNFNVVEALVHCQTNFLMFPSPAGRGIEHHTCPLSTPVLSKVSSLNFTIFLIIEGLDNKDFLPLVGRIKEGGFEAVAVSNLFTFPLP